MKVFAIVLATLAALALADNDDASYTIEEGVYALGQDDFQKHIDANEFVLVEFCKYKQVIASISLRVKWFKVTVKIVQCHCYSSMTISNYSLTGICSSSI